MKTEWYREGQTFVFYICGRSGKGAGIADRAERQPIERGISAGCCKFGGNQFTAAINNKAHHRSA